MSRVPVHSIETSPDASRPMLEAILAGPGGVGRILNVQAQLAHSPALLGAYLGIRKSIEEHATLDLRTRSAVQLIVATVDDTIWSEALDAGWTDTELAETFVCIALTTFVDSFVRFARTELDVPAQPIPSRA